MLERLKNPIFLAAVASLIYQIISRYVEVDPTMYGNIVNIITFILIGGGVWSTFSGSGSNIPQMPAEPNLPALPEMKFSQPLDDPMIDEAHQVDDLPELPSIK